jgi:hypothetical protein
MLFFYVILFILHTLLDAPRNLSNDLFDVQYIIVAFYQSLIIIFYFH